jgi:5-methylcytosine-specific restriction protein B
MHPTELTLQEAAATFDRKAAGQREAQAEGIRAEMLRLLPSDGWVSMPLERYALGQEDSSDTYGRWIEFKSIPLGSISGGSAFKDIIFKRRNKPGWAYPQWFRSETEAGSWPRAAALLARQALEQGLDDLWGAVSPRVHGASRHAQLLYLGEFIRDEEVANGTRYASHGLSRACHHQVYELSPTEAELNTLA